jgi:hypothetical protein
MGLPTTSTIVPNQPVGTAILGSSQEVSSMESVTPEVGNTDSPAPDPLDRLLTLRLIKFNLTALKGDGTSRWVEVEIDSIGNMHVKHSRPAIDLNDLPEGFDLTTLPPSYEMYVVDGKAYEPSDQNPTWMTTPVYENYIQTLTQEMHGPYSPAIWLDLLPLGNIHSAGKDTVGGFDADKYTVNGQVGGQSITGAIWFDPQTDALVQAELHVPASLLNDPTQSQQGELKITLNTQKANVRLVSLPEAPTGQTGATATFTPESTTTTGPYSLTVSNNYPFWPQFMMGRSLAVIPGKVWMGMANGIIVEVDSQSGAFGKSITLPGEGNTIAVWKLGFEGSYLWAQAVLFKKNGSSASTMLFYLFAIDPGSMTIVHQWDMNTSDWLGKRETGENFPEGFGISPGKIWIDKHVIDAQTFKVTPDISMPTMEIFAYNGIDWMWITGEMGGDCEDLLLVNAADPSKDWCPSDWPFIVRNPEGEHTVGLGSPMVLAGDRMWIGGGMSETTSAAATHVLEAYWANMDKAMQETGPLASVPLMESYNSISMFYANNYLWVVYTGGKAAGFLYQLDPQTGATINSLDLVGDKGRSIGDIPTAIASEGDNLWILTTRQLLRIKLP